MADSNNDDYLSEPQAHALWRRAAQLQSEAADRKDAMTRALATRGDADELAIHVSDVETAGVEAGIAPEFIRLARAETIAHGSKPMSPRWERVSNRFLGSRRVIELARTFEATPGRVLESIGAVFPGNPYYLNVVETLGEPAAGGVLVFDVTARGETLTSFGWDMRLSDIKRILITLQPSGNDGAQTDALLIASLNYSRRLNLAVGSSLAATAGAAGGAFGTAIGAGVLGLGALAALPALAGAAGGAALLAISYKPLYRWGLGRGQRALEGLLRAIDLRLRMGGAIPGAELPGRSG